MCLAVPAKIIEKLDNDMLVASVGDGPTRLSISGMLLAESVEIGDYVIVHAGFALHKMERTEAEESLRLFRELAAMAESGENGCSFDAPDGIVRPRDCAV